MCAHVLFPAFSRISDDSSRFRAAFLRALGWIWFAALPIGALLVVVGQPVVVLLLGEEWRSAGAAAAAMAGVGLGTALLAVAREAIKGAGRSSLLNWSTALSLVVGLPLIVLLLPFGLVGVGIAISVTYLVVGLVSVELAAARLVSRAVKPGHAWGRPRSRRWSHFAWFCRWSVSSSDRTDIRSWGAWRGLSPSACCSHSSTSVRCGLSPRGGFDPYATSSGALSRRWWAWLAAWCELRQLS